VDILDFLSAKFSGELLDRFKYLTDAQKIPLDLFRDEPNQEVLARYLMGEVAECLMDPSKEHAYIDLSIYSFMLHILGAETAGEIISTYKREASAVPAVGIAQAHAIDINSLD
jgi:hypothetical protein